ncbi:Ig-like domain-containing protein [Paenarthrobacter ureafaciens]|uniref:Ig-like domain-containing protein n=1 Tax=Paenarthrobacter ureafaciens TaxID=37931 RepID=UPI001916EA58|nr:Ig-like domain-containing protein [Paenarthrobacter ureafaciens]QQQ63574.1 fibronectin type III domain-containing protein [Paenarthrobacter ureafaciens]
MAPSRRPAQRAPKRQPSRKRRARILGVTAFTAAAAVLVTGAILYPGFKTTEVDLNDGGVWVVSKSKNAAGRLNYPSKSLDGAVTPASDDFDILQQASDIFIDDAGGATINPVSAANMRLGGDQQLPGAARVSFGSKVLAVTDPAKGKVWAVSPTSLGGFSDESTPLFEQSQGITSVVGTDDTIHTLDPKAGKLTATTVDADGNVVDSQVRSDDSLKADGDVQLTAVGGKAVVLNQANGNIILPGGSVVHLADARDAKLQQAGPEAGTVAIATKDALLLQPLDGGTATTVRANGQGTPAAPVHVGTCTYGAWSGANKYVRECSNETDNRRADVPQASASPSYVFRVNRDLVVLNDVNSGNVWMVNQNMQLVNNWDDVIPPQQTSDDADKDSADEVQQTVLPDRSKPNTPPVAKPDSFGVRAGKTTILPVLDNDADSDGDVLTVSAAEPLKSGALSPVYGGTGFQIAVPAGTTSNETFKYSVDDGRGGTAATEVDLRVVPPEENNAPQPKPNRNNTLVVQAGKIANQYILTDWIDPDGDDIFAVAASSSDPADQVRIRPDGLLTFQDSGAGPGRKTITVTVSDGTDSTDGQVVVDVRAPGALPPIANADHVVAVAGQDTVIAPLKNDTDPQGGTLRLAQAQPDGQSTAVIGPDQQTFTFNSGAVGAHYVTYMVTNGPASAQQLVRVDVVSGNSDDAPVAVRDIALLPSGGSTVVDVLGNDSDPAGGVLVVQSVTAVDGLPVSVAVLDHSVVKITDIRAEGQLSLKYTISNGKASATGDISVQVVPAPTKLQAPQAKPDDVTVRAGDVVTIPVLENDADPNGGELTLDPVLAQQPDEADGRMFVAGKTLRFIAGEEAKTVYAIYKVTNASGQSDSQQVTIRIRARDDATNTRPEPKNLTARAVAGMTVKIPVPLDGIDADGDSVQVIGIDKAPSLGTAVLRDGYLEYTAGGKSAGTDTFSYRVKDRIGAENTGNVIVGIAPAEADNQKPIAVDDAIDVRPGRRVAVDVLNNDSDPDGDPIGLVPTFDAKPGLEVEAVAGKAVLTAPGTAGVESISYRIQDDKKAEASAVIRVQTSPSAPLHAPIAVDDHVTLAETLGKTAVDVPVLKNDSDPDGVAEDLKISLPDGNPNARVGTSGNVVVTLAPQDQLVPYTVTDIDGQTATAVMWIPGQGLQYPTLSKTDVVEVTAGKEVTLSLKEWVKVRDGRSPRITVADKIKVQGGDPLNVIAGDGGALRYAAQADYMGPGSVTFEVTDGSGPDDPEGLKSTLTIMTKVLPDPNANHPPTFSGAVIDAPQGDVTELDLSNLAGDVDEQDQGKLKFEFDGQQPGGFEARIDGTVLKITPGGSLNPGARGVVPLKVTDGRSDPVRAAVTVTVVSSNRPKPVANDDAVEKADAGKPQTVNVLGNDFNPFSEPLGIVSAVVETGSAGQPEISGDSITVTPSAGSKGVLVVRYTIKDKTDDPSRQAVGRVRITVRDKPDAPSAPAATDVRSRTAVLKWAPPSDNGAAITKYTVKAAGFQQECPTTTCTLTGLTNNVSYVFTVTATNEVGESGASPASNEIKPDEKPSPPDAPAVKAGDKDLAITWTPAKTEGSPVKHYNLEISPPPGNGVAVKNEVTGLSYTWTGLTNGVNYKVRAQAVNELGPSDWSLYSAEDHPAGLPGAPAAPTTAVVSSVGSQNQLRADWTEPDINGDPIKNYYVTMSGGSGATQTQTIPGNTRTATFTANNSESGYTFTVQAENKAGKGAVSAASAPRRATGKLGTVGNVSATPANTGGAGGQLTINFTVLNQAQRNGSSANEVSYTYRASTGQSGPIQPGQTVGGFANGQAISITVTAQSSVAPSSDASAPATATPYGSPGTPSASGTNGAMNDPSVTLNWSSPSTSTNDVKTTKIRINGGAWETVAASGSRTINTGGYEQTRTIDVQTFNSLGTGGPVASASATSGKKGEWTTTMNPGAVERSCSYTLGGANYDPNRFTCDGKGGNQPPWMYTSDQGKIVVRCYIDQSDGWVGMQRWWRIESGSYRNVGRYIIAGHTYLGDPAGIGAPRC